MLSYTNKTRAIKLVRQIESQNTFLLTSGFLCARYLFCYVESTQSCRYSTCSLKWNSPESFTACSAICRALAKICHTVTSTTVAKMHLNECQKQVCPSPSFIKCFVFSCTSLVSPGLWAAPKKQMEHHNVLQVKVLPRASLMTNGFILQQRLQEAFEVFAWKFKQQVLFFPCPSHFILTVSPIAWFLVGLSEPLHASEEGTGNTLAPQHYLSVQNRYQQVGPSLPIGRVRQLPEAADARACHLSPLS